MNIASLDWNMPILQKGKTNNSLIIYNKNKRVDHFMLHGTKFYVFIDCYFQSVIILFSPFLCGVM